MAVVEVARGLHFPEGPALLGDGRLAFVELFAGRVSVWNPVDGGVTEHCSPGGVPNAAIVSGRNSMLITQCGGVVGGWRSADQRIPGIQRLPGAGLGAYLTTASDDGPLLAPNDLVLDARGSTFFTDPGEGFSPDHPGVDGRICVVTGSGDTTKTLVNTGPTFPNGIAIDPLDGGVVWVESYTRAVRKWLRGCVTLIGHVPERSVPDGLKIDVRGNMYITGTVSGGIDVMAPDGEVVDFIQVGTTPTNCAFEGATLFVTDAGVDPAPDRPVGSLWRVDVPI